MQRAFLKCTTAIVVLQIGLISSAPSTSRGARLSLADWNNYNYHEPNGPGTYAFGYDIDDAENDNVQFRNEERHANGTVTGSYGYVDPDGTARIVNYVADERGYRPTIEDSPIKLLKPLLLPGIAELSHLSENPSNQQLVAESQDIEFKSKNFNEKAPKEKYGFINNSPHPVLGSTNNILGSNRISVNEKPVVEDVDQEFHTKIVTPNQQYGYNNPSLPVSVFGSTSNGLQSAFASNQYNNFVNTGFPTTYPNGFNGRPFGTLQSAFGSNFGNQNHFQGVWPPVTTTTEAIWPGFDISTLFESRIGQPKRTLIKIDNKKKA
ncbi:uncharacterized protein LOC109601761 isoform X2 [Aethina tumida]|uniref:uncharacterized protein LOC109601761 isoform X2 n=1 Tax=Aethina tumida TaxID=116153 RepID=UPI00096ADC63|nr:uncharacterized protein LOC109601761 isoform X2 [Aethina tumida]